MAEEPLPAPCDMTDRASFPFWSRISTRFSDIDELAHVNNIATASYCETGRVELRQTIFRRHMVAEGRGFVVAKVTLTYLAQATFPGSVDVGTRVARIGRTSYGLNQGVFQNNKCFATCEVVSVHVDLKTGKPLPLPDELRHSLERFLGPVAQDA